MKAGTDVSLVIFGTAELLDSTVSGLRMDC